MLQMYFTFILHVYPQTNCCSNAGIPKLYLSMYPFGISIDEHVSLKLLITKRVRKIAKIFTNKHVMILENSISVQLVFFLPQNYKQPAPSNVFLEKNVYNFLNSARVQLLDRVQCTCTIF